VPPRQTSGGGVSPPWFFAVGALTLALGGVTAWSAIDTKNKHDAYVSSRDPDVRDSGQSAQLRTNILLGVTAASAIATGVLGIFFVGWSSGPTVTAASRF
jgi:hypothetical protein